MERPNPYNSGVLQALLDIRAANERLNNGLTDINDIIADMQKEQSNVRTVAEQINKKHRFPDACISFSQNARYDENTLFYTLPRGEQALFCLMRDIQDPVTGYVTVIKGVFAKVLCFTDTERRDMQKYLDDLTDKGFLFCNYRPTNKKPGEYKVNQGLSWIGKRDKLELKRLRQFQSEYTITDETVILADGSKISSKTLKLIDKENIQQGKNKGASAGHTDTEQDTTSPTTHNHYKQNTSKNSTPIDSNMQKNVDLLTPAEEKMFSGKLSKKEPDTGKGGFENDPNLPFNDMDSLPGQMTLSDMPGVMPNNTEENEP